MSNHPLPHGKHTYVRDCWRCRAVDYLRFAAHQIRKEWRPVLAIAIGSAAFVWLCMVAGSAALSAAKETIITASSDAKLISFTLLCSAVLVAVFGGRES